MSTVNTETTPILTTGTIAANAAATRAGLGLATTDSPVFAGVTIVNSPALHAGVQSLTSPQKAQARTNIGAVSAAEVQESSGAVRFDLKQSLTEPQQGQARANLVPMNPVAQRYCTYNNITSPAARAGINRALSYLKTEGLMPDDAGFLRTGQQPSASAPVTLSGLTGVSVGTPTLTEEGMNYEAALAAQAWTFPTPLTDFTLMLDVRGILSGQTNYGKIAHMTNTGLGYTTSGVTLGYHAIGTNGSSCLVSFSENPAYANGINSNTDPITEHQLLDAASAYSVIAGYSWKDQASPEYEIIIDGRVEIKSTSDAIRQTTPIQRLYVGTMYNNGDYGYYHAKVTVASWILYRRVITDAEKAIVTRAMRMLDPRRVVLCTMGDSLTSNVVQSPIVRSSWPIDFGGASSWSQYLRVVNYAQSGSTSADGASRAIYEKYAECRPDGELFDSGWITILFGTNDIGQDYSVAQIYANMATIAGYAKRDGFRVCIITCPQKAAGAWTTEQLAILAELNALIVLNEEGIADAVVNLSLINQIEERVTGHFDDTVHFLAAANKLISERVAGALDFEGITIPRCTLFPVISGTSVLTATNGTWLHAPLSFAYQWIRDATAISGAISASYTPVSGDNGHRLSCRVTATNASGSQSATSNATAIIPLS